MKELITLVASDLERTRQPRQKGLVEEEKARIYALDWISSLRCDDDSCFFVYDENGTLLAHPDGTLIGKKLPELKDIKGASLFQSMLEAAKTKGMAVTIFTWHCADRTKASKKPLLHLHTHSQMGDRHHGEHGRHRIGCSKAPRCHHP